MILTSFPQDLVLGGAKRRSETRRKKIGRKQKKGRYTKIENNPQLREVEGQQIEIEVDQGQQDEGSASGQINAESPPVNCLTFDLVQLENLFWPYIKIFLIFNPQVREVTGQEIQSDIEQGQQDEGSASDQIAESPQVNCLIFLTYSDRIFRFSKLVK